MELYKIKSGIERLTRLIRCFGDDVSVQLRNLILCLSFRLSSSTDELIERKLISKVCHHISQLDI